MIWLIFLMALLVIEILVMGIVAGLDDWDRREKEIERILADKRNKKK